eukprot:10713107-Heterocapsa_arctica.AAC.1
MRRRVRRWGRGRAEIGGGDHARPSGVFQLVVAGGQRGVVVDGVSSSESVAAVELSELAW